MHVLLVEDQTMFAESLARLVAGRSDVSSVSVAVSLDDLRHLGGATRVDLALVDWHLGDATGAASIVEIRRVAPDAKVVVLTGSDRAMVLDAALEAGCDGFVSKSAPVGALDAAIDAALSGDRSITARSMKAPSGVASDPGLSSRELEVVVGLVEGMSNAEIGEALFISTNTVRNHVQRIGAKLDASSRLDIAMSALRRGLVDLPR